MGLPAEVVTRDRPGSAASSARRCAALSSLVALTLASCLEYSPNALPTDDSERDLNRKAIARLQTQPPGAADAIRFAVVGDVHYSYDQLGDAVDRLNAIDGIEFVVQIGDFTDVGTVQEYRLAKGRFDALRVPYLVVLGNHDMLGRGDEIFDRMFGMRDGTFDYRGARFLMVDTNSREYGFGGEVPRLDSLANALRVRLGRRLRARARARLADLPLRPRAPDQLRLRSGFGGAPIPHPAAGRRDQRHLRSRTRVPVYAITGKVTWRPWALELGRDLELRPITGALQLTYTFGSDYFVKEPSRYPSGYYEIATAIHSGVAFGSALSWRTRNESRVGVYYELVALDMMLNAWIRNRSSISLDDVFSFAIGASLEF